MSEKDCELAKLGTDTHIGNYFKAPCGWSTYNFLDISHYQWHDRGIDVRTCEHVRLASGKRSILDPKTECPDCGLGS
jgi:hypothetical protein